MSFHRESASCLFLTFLLMGTTCRKNGTRTLADISRGLWRKQTTDQDASLGQRPPTCHLRMQIPPQGSRYPPIPKAGLAPHLCLSTTHTFWTGGLEPCFLVLFLATDCLYVLVPSWLCNSNSSSNDMLDVPVEEWGRQNTTQFSITH